MTFDDLCKEMDKWLYFDSAAWRCPLCGASVVIENSPAARVSRPVCTAATHEEVEMEQFIPEEDK